ncbi:hypothetical protein [Paeniglutamicibacter kerguelensis]|uniref:MFS transporter n=1 Tax=Paeniglutamicibacter kerguelensis TaxID=254788 RepID=A0ABS4XCZ7_9MICC|nr:hypothetical protein [Paeniglutamicibacter kerguelensis]MBP2385539.1 hypothetical protein [Paeniglutamicibacter kerguelensis]
MIEFYQSLIVGSAGTIGQAVRGWGLCEEFRAGIGAARIMTFAAVGTLVTALPLFILLVNVSTIGTMIGIELVFGFLATAYFAPLPALRAAIFPPQIRTTGMSLGYNIAVTVFGGFAPFILTWLIAGTGSLLAPSFYLLAIAAVSLSSLVVVRRVYKQS